MVTTIKYIGTKIIAFMNQKTNMPVKHATNEVNDATSVLAENDQKFS